MKQKVLAWIAENFTPGSITVEEFPLMPHGYIVRDASGGEMLVYYDLLTDTVKYRLQGAK